MSKSFFNRSWLGERRTQRALVVVGVVILILLMSSVGPGRIVSQTVRHVAVAGGTSAGKFLRRLGIGADEWQQQAVDCQADLSQAVVEKSELEQLKKLVLELEESIDYQSSVDGQVISARILARQNSHNKTLLLDRGSNDQIAQGQAVVVGGGHLIGIIQSLDSYTSTVRLLSDPNSKVPAAVLGSKTQSGLIVGEDGYLLTLSFVPQDQPLYEDDLIVTSGLEGWLPAGLVIGTVSEVTKEERAPFQTARVSPIVNADDFASVSVINQTFVP